MTFARLIASTAASLTLAGAVAAQDTSIIVQSTTSTANSGLYDYLLPIYTGESGITVNVVAVGTGQAIKNAENCDGDLLLVHAKPSEEKFVAAGYGTQRTDLMYNDFVIVGPRGDPARINGMHDAVAALGRIAAVSLDSDVFRLSGVGAREKVRARGPNQRDRRFRAGRRANDDELSLLRRSTAPARLLSGIMAPPPRGGGSRGVLLIGIGRVSTQGTLAGRCCRALGNPVANRMISGPSDDVIFGAALRRHVRHCAYPQDC